ncbi:MAG: hypothetical protein FWH36_08845 [Lentimicrobiaceae bacterium]|nr:hypothetical protein [Lentimicrobiaceae bacterium]
MNLQNNNNNLVVSRKPKGGIGRKIVAFLVIVGGVALFVSCGKCDKNAPDKIFEDGVEKKLTGWKNENKKTCTPEYEPVKNPENCDGPQNTYDAAAGKAYSDSTAYVDFKSTVPGQIMSSIKQMMNNGKTEEEAWDEAINGFITHPNAPQDLKEWAQSYQNYLDSFNKSVAEREAALKALIECQQRLIGQ